MIHVKPLPDPVEVLGPVDPVDVLQVGVDGVPTIKIKYSQMVKYNPPDKNDRVVLVAC